MIAADDIQTLDIDIDRTSLSVVPHLDQWSGLWMIEPTRLNFLTHAITSIDLDKHLNKSRFESPDASDYREDRDGIAIIKLEGTLQKHSMSIGAATSTVLARRAIKSAVDDPSVRGILLSIESPGGTAVGTKELADEVTAAKAVKPVHAHITDLGASAAYWIASQADHVTANEMALVGSIGTYQVVSDLSAVAADRGIKVHVVRAGEFKGTGVPGTEITPSQLAYLQNIVESRNALFVSSVASGRGVDPAVAMGWADGRAHAATAGQSMGLIDEITSEESAFAALLSKVQSSPPTPSRRIRQVSESTPDTVAVTPKLIREKCPGCDDSFVVAMLDEGHSIERCRDEHMRSMVTANESLSQQLATANGRIDELQSELDEAKSRGVGVPGMAAAEQNTPEQSAADAFWSAVQSEQDQGRTRDQAIAAVNRRQPELRTAMIAEANSRS